MTPPGRRTAALALVTVSLAGIQACGDEEEPAAGTSTATTTENAPETSTGVDQPAGDRPADKQLEALLAAPERFLDERVTVTGEIDGATPAPGAFRLDRPRGDRGIVVLATEKTDGVSRYTAGDTVTVTGRVLRVDQDLPDEATFLLEQARKANDEFAQIETPYVVSAESVEAGG